MKHLSNSAAATLLSKSQEVHFYECIHHLLGLCSQGLAPNPTKVKAILDWHDPTTDTEVRSFHGLATFIDAFCKILEALWRQSLIVWRNANFNGPVPQIMPLRRLSAKWQKLQFYAFLILRKFLKLLATHLTVVLAQFSAMKATPLPSKARNFLMLRRSFPVMIWNFIQWYKPFNIDDIIWLEKIILFSDHEELKHL